MSKTKNGRCSVARTPVALACRGSIRRPCTGVGKRTDRRDDARGNWRDSSGSGARGVVRWTLSTVLVTSLLAAATTSVRAQVDGLFHGVPEGGPSLSTGILPVLQAPAGGAIPGEAPFRHRHVRIDLERLADVHSGIGRGALQVLTLNLFDDIAFSATVERTSRTSAGGYSLSGPLVGVGFGTMTLVVNGDVVAGRVHTPLVTYEIRPVGRGRAIIREADRSFQCDVAMLSTGANGPFGDGGHPALFTADVARDSSDEGPEDGSVIDLLVVYTRAAKLGFGGTTLIEAFIDLAVADANRSLEDSGVIQRINLVRQKEIAYTESTGRSLSAAYYDEVNPLRDSYAADLVHLIHAGSFLGGWGQILGAYGATNYARLGLLTHELGHQMGLRHDRYLDASNDPFPYSHGYINQAAFEPDAPWEIRFATNMAYNRQCGDAGFFCPWTNTFSNPDMTYNGYPMGVPGDEPSSAVDGPADARRSLNELRRTVANFRVRESGPDLVVHSPTVSDPILEPSQAFTFSALLRNIGDVPATRTLVSYYRSRDSAITPLDTLVGTDIVAGLPPATADEASIELVAPENAGIYYYGACVQSVGDEIGVTNNCSWGAWMTVGSGIDTACQNDLGGLSIPGSITFIGAWHGECHSSVQYQFRLERSAGIRIDLTSPSVDTFLYLRDARGTLTVRDWNGGDDTNARIVATLDAGRYSLSAIGYPSGVDGPFVLSMVTTGENRAPVPAGRLGPITLEVGGVKAVEVAAAFRDPDGDVLRYEARSSAPGVATATAVGSTVTVTAVSEGTAGVTVTASDSGGLSAKQTMSVAVRRLPPFTDDPIVPGVTVVRAIHFTELRSRIDAARVGAGLARFNWTDAILSAGGTRVRLAHLVELRLALTAAYEAAGRTPPVWTDSSPMGGRTAIRAAHVMELRAAVRALE